ncbi:MAG: glycosyl transferase [Clostridia bacterium]|nr:glycosyl transferase [Clostridia bacterium]
MGKGLVYKIRRKCQVAALKLTSPEFMSKIYFKAVLGKKLNLKNPQTFNEKLQWLKLYEWPNNPIAVQCGDKFTVREYVEQKGMGEYLNDLIGVWENVDDIDWDSLPNQFAMKCTHGCAYNIICDDKSKLDIEKTKKTLKQWMKEDFGKFNVELHYSKMKPRIICEKFLGGNMVDYKFFCFKGKSEFMYIAQGFGKGDNEQITFFDKAGKKAPFGRSDYPVYEDATLPESYEKMKALSEELAKDLPFVRVDWFEVDGKIYFGELTFTPCGGLMKITPDEYDGIWGKLIDLDIKGASQK